MTQRDFRSWRERLVAWVARVGAVAGTIPSRIRYSRKSTESQDRQVHSHDQQSAEADKKWGAIDREFVWADDRSGTTFDRPEFQDMLAFCLANPRKKSDPGRVEIYDPSRFGRILDSEGAPDIMAFLAVYSQFESAGWQLHFVTVQRTGDGLVDAVTMALYAYAAALYSVNLSKNARRGRVKHAADGWWTAGTAPWGTLRKDTSTNRILKPGQRSAAGGGGVILVGDQPVLKLWRKSALRILGGASLDKVGAELYEKGVRGPKGGKLGHSSIRNLLTNRALIGQVEYHDQPDDEGNRARRRVKAKWESLVDVELFEKVSERLKREPAEDGGERRQRRRRDLFPIRPVCAHCGVDYNGGRLGAGQGSARVYAHAQPKARANETAYQRRKEAGCKVWNVDALELEEKIKDLIVSERTSVEFQDDVRALLLERDEFRKSAADAVTAARASLEQLTAKQKDLARAVAKLAGQEGFDDNPLLGELDVVRRRIQSAREELARAERFAQSRENAWERLCGIIHETRNIAAAWAKSGPEERKILLDYWVYDVLIVVEPIPGKKRANRKTAVVTLRTAPNAPKHFALGGGQPPSAASADRSSPATPGSSSDESRSRSGCSAAGEPILPNAHAACPRTSGSSSASTATSAGMSSGAPTFPSTTDALRRSPRSFARFMGEPLNEAENSACDMDSSESASDRASLPASAALGAYGESSNSSIENLRLYGHTSWHTSHP
ncbi:Recombinase [Gemmatirosa kalamazoonensis]|uniref:Recombinase n=1 Tax=Gemmatirosa kalamazoonensis TaxID=861299 RepID=W0RHE3_9BACT|nr:Recombinase [Gemmatirosa kalamazoonensis]